MSKHSERRARRAEYHRMLDAEIAKEGQFVGRVLRTMWNGGLDVAPDGDTNRADYWRYIESRRKPDLNMARAGLSLVEKAITSVRVRRP